MRFTLETGLTVWVITLFLIGSATTARQAVGSEPGSAEIQTPNPEFRSSCLWECSCDRVSRRGRSHIAVHCLNRPDFPLVTPSDTTSLVLRDSSIGRIEDTSLRAKGLKRLEHLECTACQITDVGLNAFRHLQKLKTIVLRDNGITTLTADRFAAQKHLTLLDLTGNPILDCDALTRGLPNTCVLCDVVTGTSPEADERLDASAPIEESNGKFSWAMTTGPMELVTTLAADSPPAENAMDNSGPKEYYNGAFPKMSSTEPPDAQGEIPNGTQLWLVVGLVVMGVAAVAVIVLSIVYRRQIRVACNGMKEHFEQKWQALPKDEAVARYER